MLWFSVLIYSFIVLLFNVEKLMKYLLLEFLVRELIFVGEF